VPLAGQDPDVDARVRPGSGELVVTRYELLVVSYSSQASTHVDSSVAQVNVDISCHHSCGS